MHREQFEAGSLVDLPVVLICPEDIFYWPRILNIRHYDPYLVATSRSLVLRKILRREGRPFVNVDVG